MPDTSSTDPDKGATLTASHLKTTLIMTVFNEGEALHGVLDSFAAQTRPPDEIVIVDGGSTDQTVAILRDYTKRLPLKVLESPGANISEGRNIAIGEASGDVIAATDAGTRLPPEWLARLVTPLAEDPNLMAVAGFFHADPHTPFEVAMGATVLPLADEIAPDQFLPSSRSVAFRREAWAAVGGYPEWLDYCEDLIFDLNLKTQYGRIGWAPGACVAFRPRTHLRAFWTQYFRYARGDGKADLWRKRHAIRYATYLVVGPLLALLGLRGKKAAWGLLALGGAAYIRRPIQRLDMVWTWYKGLRAPSTLDRLKALLWIPVIRVVGDVAKMVGYPAGWAWRLRHQPPEWRIDRRQ